MAVGLKKNKFDEGFTLIEIIITVALLATITMGVASMLRGSFDLKLAITEKNRIKHKLEVIMQRINDDLSQAFIVASNDLVKWGKSQNIPYKTLFQIISAGDADELLFTSMSHDARVVGRNESEITFIHYVLKESQEKDGKKNLYRGSSGRLPIDIKETPPLQLLATSIKSMTFAVWNGEDWARDRAFDTNKTANKDRLPRMVKVKIEAIVDEFQDEEVAKRDLSELPVEKIETVVYLPYGAAFKQEKEAPKSLNWKF